jgi:putative NADPH-quinone reductase
LILGHTFDQGFCGRIFDAYAKGAEGAGHEVKKIKLGELKFDPILHDGYRKIQELEPDLKSLQADILWADHLTIVFPTWWASFPAILKGFFDRVILPGFGFKFGKDSFLAKKLLRGKTARLITTMDGPALSYLFWLRAPGINAIKKGVLNFCGVSPVKSTIVGSLKFLSDKQKAKRLQEMERLGVLGK